MATYRLAYIRGWAFPSPEQWRQKRNRIYIFQAPALHYCNVSETITLINLNPEEGFKTIKGDSGEQYNDSSVGF